MRRRLCLIGSRAAKRSSGPTSTKCQPNTTTLRINYHSTYLIVRKRVMEKTASALYSIRYGFAFNTLAAYSRKGLVDQSPFLILLVAQNEKNAFLPWRSCTNSCEEPFYSIDSVRRKRICGSNDGTSSVAVFQTTSRLTPK